MTKKSLLLLGFIVLKFLLQYLLINPNYELHRDEYLHLDQASHLAWGYLSVPPLTSWVAYMIHAFGNSLFWIRCFPALFGALTILVVWKAVEELQGKLFALILAATAILLSALIRINFLFQPNSFDVLSWTTLAYFLIRYFQSQRAKWLYIAAVVFAMGFLNKYNILFLLIGFLPSILLTEQRNIFARKEFYISIVLALVLISPNLVWQYNNHFPVFHHMKVLADTQLINVNRSGFIKEQLFYFIGSLPIIIASLVALLFYPPFKKYTLFFWTFIFTLGIFIYLRAKGYYAIGLYPIYISFGSVFLSDILNTGWKKYVRWLVLALPILVYVLFFKVVFSMQAPQDVFKNQRVYHKYGMLRWEDGKEHALPQDYADMLGWKELAEKVETVFNKLPNRQQTIILCDNYGQAGAINYYTKNKEIKAVSFNADYINWMDLNTKILNFIRVKEAEGSQFELKETSPYFGSSVVADSVSNALAREFRTTIFVFTKPTIDINKRLRDEIEKYKRRN